MLGYVPDDGFTQRGYIEAVERLHPALRFSYRPVSTDANSQFVAGAAVLKRQERDRKLAEFVAKRLVQWDLSGADGQTLPITQGTLLRTTPTLFDKLTSIVFGTMPSDEDPEWDESEKASHAADKF